VKINLFRSGVTLAAVAATAVGGITTLTAHAADVVPFACPTGAAAVSADGSSFQNNGVQAAITAYGAACPGNGAVTYTSTGSGTGIADFTARKAQFAGTDVPYTDAQWAAMIQGSGTNASLVETLPIALGAVAVVYTAPAGCTVPTGTQVSGATLSKLYSGQVPANWNQIVPSCNAAMTLNVRTNGSGTSKAFKDYLFKKDPVTWANFNNGSSAPAGWPAPSAVTGCGTTNAAMITCAQTAGNIAYVDYSDANARSMPVFAIDNAAGTFALPGTAGVCTQAATTGATPPSTLLDWSTVSITNGPTGYGDCTYTYQLAFVTPVQAGAATAAQAANVKGFISYEVSDAGQNQFASKNYEKLPPQVQALAQVGAATLTSN
jgi:phosphate transport system substrate-binding protein